MDKLELLKQYFESVSRSVIKYETIQNYGFDFLNTIKDNIVYTELLKNISKYKLQNLTEEQFDTYLMKHIEKQDNVCAYFNTKANNVFIFNIDEEKKGLANATAKYMYNFLVLAGIEPMMLKSGRGWHLWCRLTQRVPNAIIADYMIQIILITTLWLKFEGYDEKKVNISRYPMYPEKQSNSLRFPMSYHVRTKEFSNVSHPIRGELSEEESWDFLKEHMETKSLTVEEFKQSLGVVKDMFYEFTGEADIPEFIRRANVA